MLEQRIQQHFFDSADLKYQIAENLLRPIAEAAGALLGAITAGGKVMCCGSGPASALAPYMAGLLVGQFERERPPLAALALVEQPAAAKQLQALGHPGDALLLIDGGDAAQVQAAMAAAHDKDMTVVLLTHSDGATYKGTLGETDVLIAVPHERAARVRELHLLVLHCLCDAIDLQLLGEQEP